MGEMILRSREEACLCRARKKISGLSTVSIFTGIWIAWRFYSMEKKTPKIEKQIPFPSQTEPWNLSPWASQTDLERSVAARSLDRGLGENRERPPKDPDAA